MAFRIVFPDSKIQKCLFPILGVTLVLTLGLYAQETKQKGNPGDQISQYQAEAVATKKEKKSRPWHFGSQSAGDVYSNHTSHSNRLIPVYTFGSKINLGDVAGVNSLYRDSSKVRALYGYDAKHTHNPQADYFDQTDLKKIQEDAVKKGVKHLFIVWFDGLDWETTQAAAAAKSGVTYSAGKGTGLIFQDYKAGGTAKYGYYVTSPSHDEPSGMDVNRQTISFDDSVVRGGYDASIAGMNPWTPGPLASKAPGYLKGSAGNASDKKGVLEAGRAIHAYTDSSTSAASAFNGVKSYNNSVNVTADGKPVRTLWHDLQNQGWKLGTVTSVPFNHASPAATYTRNIFRDDYQDIARDMLGLKTVMVENGQVEQLPGLDVVLGAGVAKDEQRFQHVKDQGENSADGSKYLAKADKEAADVKNGGKYVVVERTSGVSGHSLLQESAKKAAASGHRLFGVFGTQYGHLPYRTTDADYKPVAGMRGTEVYTEADLNENPTLSDMTRAALTVLTAHQGKPFSLFVEAGDVDFALHDNNLDNAIGALYSGEAAIQVIIDWVEKNSNWNDSAMIVTADHGHMLQIRDINALAGHAAGKVDKRERRD
ncbi:MAG: hypothetical protein RJA81_894 [Planctomycetota bacterium]|jgi:alkaline phosphatase